MYEDVMPFTSFDVQSIDCHVLNPSSRTGEIPETAKQMEATASLIVHVSGAVRLEEPQKGPLKQFSETLVLVPNPEKHTASTSSTSNQRNWLIQNQNFRYVV
jgi:NTF2-related export protein 1/2